MGNKLEINKILKINNEIINVKKNNPNDYFSIKSLKNKMSKQISKVLDNNYSYNYMTGPSIPSIESSDLSDSSED